MSLYMPASSTQFELPPEGIHPAYCYRLIDLGTQPRKGFQGAPDTEARMLLVGFELAIKERNKEGKAFTIGKQWKLSGHAKANMRKDIESWRGKKFTNDDEAMQYDVSKIVGAKVILDVQREIGQDGKEYAGIKSFIAPAKMPTLTFEPATLERQYFVLEKGFNAELLENLSDKLRAKIKSSPEYARLVNGAGSAHNGGSGISAAEMQAARQAVIAEQSAQGAQAKIDFEGDTIPF